MKGLPDEKINKNIYFISFIVFIVNGGIHMNNKSIVLSFRVSEDKFDMIMDLADRHNLPISWWLRTLVYGYLEKGSMDRVNLP